MAKKQKRASSQEFTLKDAHRYVQRGIHALLGAVEDARKRDCPICDEVWKYIVTTFWGNIRAKNLVAECAPQFAPAPAAAK